MGKQDRPIALSQLIPNSAQPRRMRRWKFASVQRKVVPRVMLSFSAAIFHHIQLHGLLFRFGIVHLNEASKVSTVNTVSTVSTVSAISAISAVIQRGRRGAASLRRALFFTKPLVGHAVSSLMRNSLAPSFATLRWQWRTTPGRMDAILEIINTPRAYTFHFVFVTATSRSKNKISGQNRLSSSQR
jgi:hypothetical protein